MRTPLPQRLAGTIPQSGNIHHRSMTDIHQRSMSAPPSITARLVNAAKGVWIRGSAAASTSSCPHALSRSNSWQGKNPCNPGTPAACHQTDEYWHQVRVPEDAGDHGMRMPQQSTAPVTALCLDSAVHPPWLQQSPSATPNLFPPLQGPLRTPMGAPAFLAPSVNGHYEQSYAHWEADADQSTAYLTRSQLPSGKLSMIVDSGAFQNMIGEDFVNSLGQAAQQSGVVTSRTALKPLNISGVGNGAHACAEQIS